MAGNPRGSTRIAKTTDQEVALGKEQLDANIMKVSQILMKLRRSPEWPRIRRLILHVDPGCDDISKIQIEETVRFLKVP
jgi:hypothetical protein